MAELLAAIVELLSIPFQIVGELLATIIAGIFRAAFSKQRLDENGQPTPNDNRPANRWEVFGYSLLGTATLALIVGGICFFIWGTFFAAQWGAAISAFLGGMGALKAAAE